MIYRITVRSNPRILALFIVLPAIVAAGVAMIYLLGAAIGLAALAFAIYFAYMLGKMGLQQLRTRIKTDDDGIVFTLHNGQKAEFPWTSITLAGISVEPEKRGTLERLFVYRGDSDRLMAVTREFENFDGLAAEVRAKVELRNVTLASGEGLKAKLKSLLGVE